MPTTYEPGLKFDPTKPCRTRDGRAVRILCTDAGGESPIVALVPRALDPMRLKVERYAPDGTCGRMPDPYRGVDLVNVPERHTLLVALAQDEHGKPYYFNPDRFQARARIGHICVTVEGARIVGAEILP